MAFAESLIVELTLLVDGERFEIPPGQIKKLSLNARSFGFDGRAEFVVATHDQEDKLYPALCKPELLELELSIAQAQKPKKPPPALAIKAPVTSLEFEEEFVADHGGGTLLYRRVFLEFKDLFAAFWTAHFPVQLYADATLEDVIKAQLAGGMATDYAWPRLKEKHQVITLTLTENGRASFYDWLAWLCHRDGGIWTYDYITRKLRLGAKKAEGKANKLARDLVASARWELPPASRQNVRILNALAEGSAKTDEPLKQGFQGLRRDTLLVEPVAARVQKRQNVEKARPREPKSRLEVTLKAWPNVDLRPNTLIKIDKKEYAFLGAAGGATMRCRRLRLDLQAVDNEAEAGHALAKGDFQVSWTSLLEFDKDTDHDLPGFNPPPPLILAEGKVISEIGGEEDRSYQISEDSDSSAEQVRVKIPLWNKDVVIPFEPGLRSSQLYFPLVRSARVIVKLFPFHAELDSVRAWSTDVRMPLDGQGNHILFGKNAESYTTWRHYYESEKPILQLKRQHGQDTERIEAMEGTMILETKEDESAKKAKDTVDLTPKAIAARAELSGEGGAALAKASAEYEKGRADLDGKIDGAYSELEGKLDEMEAKIDAAVTALRGELAGALSDIQGQAGVIDSKAAAMSAGLQAAGTL